jgi:hypothetical protein
MDNPKREAERAAAEIVDGQGGVAGNVSYERLVTLVALGYLMGWKKGATEIRDMAVQAMEAAS